MVVDKKTYSLSLYLTRYEELPESEKDFNRCTSYSLWCNIFVIVLTNYLSN